MNKKRYTAPALQTVSIAHQAHILASSPGIEIGEGSASKGGAVLSRRSNDSWDDAE